MATRDLYEPIDFWATLEDAEETVASWPAWQQRYDADVYGNADDTAPPLSAD